MSSSHDVVVVGGGPGGYAAALYAAAAGLDVALVEKQKLGGTCLHVGLHPGQGTCWKQPRYTAPWPTPINSALPQARLRWT